MAGYETSLRTGLDLFLSARVERQTSVGREAKSAVNDFLGGDGLFPAESAGGRGDVRAADRRAWRTRAAYAGA